MKKLKSIYGMVAFLTILPLVSSCRSNNGLDGPEDNDPIQLSATSGSFGQAADSTVITSKGSWWISSVKTNSKNYASRKDTKVEGYSLWDVLIKKDTTGYQLKTRIGDFTDAIKDDFFDIKQIGNDTLSVKFNVNDSSEERYAIITVESGDNFKTVTIRQAGK